MNRFLLMLLVALVGVPVLVMSFAYIRNKTGGPELWAYDDTVKALKRMSKDPDSLVIKEYFIVKKPNDTLENIYVCGIADGKNSFGAMSGGNRFVSISMRSIKAETFDFVNLVTDRDANYMQAVQLERLVPFDSVYWNEMCVDEKHPAIKFMDYLKWL